MSAVSTPNPWGYGLGGGEADILRLLRTVHSKNVFGLFGEQRMVHPQGVIWLS